MKKKDFVIYQDCLSENAKTLDEYIFDYFNNAYPDEMDGVIKAWKAKLADDGKCEDYGSEVP